MKRPACMLSPGFTAMLAAVASFHRVDRNV